MKEIVIYSSMILVQMIATQLNATVDQVLIGSLVASSSAILAVYSVGTQITQYYQSIGTAFTGVLMPGIVKMVEKGADSTQLTNEMIRIGRIILIVLGLIWSGFLTCGQQFITLWAGQANTDAYLVAVILMTAYMFILTESIGTQIDTMATADRRNSRNLHFADARRCGSYECHFSQKAKNEFMVLLQGTCEGNITLHCNSCNSRVCCRILLKKRRMDLFVR